MSQQRPDLSRAFKPVDCWWTVAAVDPVAARVLPFLLRYPRITPDAVTIAAFALGGVAVAAFATGHFVLGALLYELRFFLDCLDGKIARVRRTSSPFGAAFDQLADSLTIPAAYAVIGLVLAHRGDLPASLALLLAFMAAIVQVAELSLSLVRRSSAAGPVIASAGAGGVLAWMRRHRLTARPWTVEAETLGLFLGPLVLSSVHLGRLDLALVGVYGIFLIVDLVLVLVEARRSAS